MATQETGKKSELELELDRVAWNLPSPPPEEVRLPPATSWPVAQLTKQESEVAVER